MPACMPSLVVRQAPAAGAHTCGFFLCLSFLLLLLRLILLAGMSMAICPGNLLQNRASRPNLGSAILTPRQH